MGQSISNLSPEITLSPKDCENHILACYESEGYSYLYNFENLKQCIEWIEYYADEAMLCSNTLRLDQNDVLKFFSIKVAKKVYTELLKSEKFGKNDDKVVSNDLVISDECSESDECECKLMDESSTSSSSVEEQSEGESKSESEECSSDDSRKRKSTISSYNLRTKKAKY